eukprot:TRINITY_DN1865_c0_g1_i13.p1 TRINITY_DN1865_c0_g1~~TRINITY_DN1865_c0_g1_i13.p1  ORF type:complete len:231 (-),score=64.80 TRINITY_DN1865_c0_g1_i13:558-1190(-)
MGNVVVSQPSHWAKDRTVAQCPTCTVEFDFFERRHHCRLCGGIFCDTCSSWRAPIREQSTEEERVCKECVDVLKGRAPKMVSYWLTQEEVKEVQEEQDFRDSMLDRYPDIKHGPSHTMEETFFWKAANKQMTEIETTLTHINSEIAPQPNNVEKYQEQEGRTNLYGGVLGEEYRKLKAAVIAQNREEYMMAQKYFREAFLKFLASRDGQS